MAIVLGGIVFVGTVVLAFLTLMADEMSDNPSAYISPWPTLIAGTLIAVVLASSHWWGPHIRW